MRRLVQAWMLGGLALAAPATARGRPVAPEEILRKAEDVRNPELDYAVDFTIHGVTRGATPSERDASYSMIASGKDRSVILMRSPEMLYGSTVLMADGHAWMLLPKASKTWELSNAQMINGDVASGDLARANLLRDYSVTLAGEEPIDEVPCWRLTLTAQSEGPRYGRVDYWIAKRGARPQKLDYYGRSGKLAKTVRYGGYQKGPLGFRSMQLTIESFSEFKEGCSLTFSSLRKLRVHPASFTPEGMMRIRDAAMAEHRTTGKADAAVERFVEAVR